MEDKAGADCEEYRSPICLFNKNNGKDFLPSEKYGGFKWNVGLVNFIFPLIDYLVSAYEERERGAGAGRAHVLAGEYYRGAVQAFEE